MSSRSQSLDVQVQALSASGVKEDHLYQEIISGRQRQGRAALEEMLLWGIRRGDAVVCTRLDRLARSTRDLLQIAETLEINGVNLKVLEQPIDTTSAAGRLFFTILGTFGGFEGSIRAERQREAIDASLAKGDDNLFNGRPAPINDDQVRHLHQNGMSSTAIGRGLGIARSSVYRYLEPPVS